MQQMVKRAVKSADPLLFKLVKTISSHEGKPREYFISTPTIVADIVRMTKSATSTGISHYKTLSIISQVPLLVKFC